MTVRTRDLKTVDVRKAMRDDLNEFIAGLDLRGKTLGFANNLYTHPEGMPEGVHVVICCVACPTGDSALELQAKIGDLVHTFLTANGWIRNGENTRPAQ